VFTLYQDFREFIP